MTALTTGEVLAAEFAKIHGQPVPVPATEQDYREAVHALPDTGQAALCLSGGGIRSAAFSLGVLQGLARHKLLSRFHYLSTVSGGGYIGGWLTAWAYRAKERGKTFADVETELSAKEAAPRRCANCAACRPSSPRAPALVPPTAGRQSRM